MSRPIRLLLVDDSETILTLLQELIGGDPDFLIVGTARNGSQAIALAHLHKPDIITMDLLMPEVDGLAAIRKLTAEGSFKIVALTTLSAATISFRALEAGALEVLHKPVAYHTQEGQEAFGAMLARLKTLALAGAEEIELAAPLRVAQAAGRRFCGIAVAASTGGPPAIKTLLQGLSPEFPLPILVVQHISEGFVTAFVEWLNNATPVQAVVAQSGHLPQAGKVYVGPDGCHLTLSGAGRIVLSPAPPVNSHRPSADLLFESVGRAWKEEALALVLTGMGKDGTAGLTTLKQMGGYCLAQDQRSCQVFGMPAAAIAAGLADEIMGLEEMSDFLRSLETHPKALDG